MTNKLNCRVIGDGYPVVFLHGFLESISMWDAFQFTDAKCVFIDLPGHGASKLKPSHSITMEEIANQVKILLDDLQISKYSVVGHSMGAYIGLEMKKDDNRCESVFLLNSNFWSDDERKKQDRERVSKLVLRNKRHFLYEAIPNLFYQPERYDKEIKFLINEATKISSESISNLSIALSNRNDFTELVHKNPTDFVIVQGTFDSVVPKELMMANNKGIEYHELPESAHMSYLENSKNVQDLIQNFIKMKNGN